MGHPDQYMLLCCIGLNVKFRSQSFIAFNTIVYSTFHEFYITGLKMTKLGVNMLPEQSTQYTVVVFDSN